MDPNTGERGYIGKADDPYTRLNKHLSTARNTGKHTHLLSWLRNLITASSQPEIVIIDCVQRDEWKIAERGWIAELLADDYALVNTMPGGEGQPGGNDFPAELRERLIAVNRGNREQLRKAYNENKAEIRVKIANALRGRTRSPEHSAAISRALIGKKHGPYKAHRKPGRRVAWTIWRMRKEFEGGVK